MFGAARPAPDAQVRTVQEKRPGPARIETTVQGTTLDVHLTQPSSCRNVTVTSATIREVDVRRSFVDPKPQAWDVATALLLGGAAGFMTYNADGTWACNSTSATCLNSVGTASMPIAVTMAVASAIPLGFAIYNATRVQNERHLERTGAFEETGEWHSCSVAPLPNEAVALVAGDSTLHATTNADGHAAFDLTSLAANERPRKAVVQWQGSGDVEIELPAAGYPAGR